MVGIYKYENGLKFTGKVAASKEEAEAYLKQKHGKYYDNFVGYAEDGTKIYEKKFYPWYREDAYEIIGLEVVTVQGQKCPLSFILCIVVGYTTKIVLKTFAKTIDKSLII